MTDGPSLQVFDGDGNLWQLDPETGDHVAFDDGNRYFADPDCSSTEHFAATLPRVVVQRDGRYLTRSDDAGFTCAAAFRSGPAGSCILLGSGSCFRVVPENRYREVDLPDPVGVPPFRPEPF